MSTVAHGVNATGGGGGHSTAILSISCGEPDCDRIFGSEGARQSHLTYQHGIGKDPIAFNCRVDTCTASFGTELNRDEHMREQHRGPLRLPDDAKQRLDAAMDARAPRPAGTVLTTPAARAAVEVDTSDDLSEDAGSIPAPRSERDVSGATPEREGEQMATKYRCSDSDRFEGQTGEAGCDELFDTAQGRAMHVTLAHLGKPGESGKSGKTRKAPSRVEPSTPPRRRGDPAKNLVVIKLDQLQLEGLLELVRGAQANGDLDTSDPKELRREAGRLQLLAALQEASE